MVLLAYPLQYRMDHTLKRSNLNIYANVTRDTGPAMTWSMHALGHLDIGDVPSETMFNRTFVPYIRKPFYTWNEYVNGVKDGAENFITGAGGFLQLIMYGYTGIRLNADALIISGSQLPPQTTKMILNGNVLYMSIYYHCTVIIRLYLCCTTQCACIINVGRFILFIYYRVPKFIYKRHYRCKKHASVLSI